MVLCSLELGQIQLQLQATKHTNYVFLEKPLILKINGFKHMDHTHLCYLENPRSQDNFNTFF